MIPTKDWKWFGNPGHFICSCWCRFHLCTQVGVYLISTVGEYVHPRHSKGNEQDDTDWWKKNWPGENVGAGRKYETTVFEAGEICGVENCLCGIPAIGGDPLDFSGYNLRRDAAQGHLAMCQKWAVTEKQERNDEIEKSYQTDKENTT